MPRSSDVSILLSPPAAVGGAHSGVSCDREARTPQSSDQSIPLTPPLSSATPAAAAGAHPGVTRDTGAASQAELRSGNSFAYGTPPKERYASPTSCHSVANSVDMPPGRQRSTVANQTAGALSPAVAEQRSGDRKVRGADADVAASRSYASWREVYWALCELEPLVDQAVWSHLGAFSSGARVVHRVVHLQSMRIRTVRGCAFPFQQLLFIPRPLLALILCFYCVSRL